jgi:hypothetical protein
MSIFSTNLSVKKIDMSSKATGPFYCAWGCFRVFVSGPITLCALQAIDIALPQQPVRLGVIHY